MPFSTPLLENDLSGQTEDVGHLDKNRCLKLCAAGVIDELRDLHDDEKRAEVCGTSIECCA